MKKTIVCLVSHQAMANVIPVFELKPDNVILLITPEEEEIAANLKELFGRKKINASIHPKKIDAYNLDLIKKECSNIINSVDGEVILNITGGTKPMAVSAFEIFKIFNKKIIYNDPINNEIMVMYPPDIKPQPVCNSISVEDYLTAHGYKITEHKTNTGRAEKKKNLFEYMDKKRLNEFIEFFNMIKSKSNLSKSTEKYEHKNFIFSKNKDSIIINDNNTRQFCKTDISNFNFGDWLEDILYLILKKKEHDDIKYGVKLIKNNFKNEIDVMLTKDYKLFLYSCKDKKIKTKFDLYEIEVLRNVTGGTFGKGVFVLPQLLTEKDRYLSKFAKNLNIEIVLIKDMI